jgi:hypothetical protein
VLGRPEKYFKRTITMNDTINPDGKQVVEFSQSELRADELEKQCKEQLKDKTSPEYAPLPLQRSADPIKPFPFDALGPIAGTAARRIHEVVQAPGATCGQSVLAALSLACQAFVDVEVDGRIHPTSLFFITISESGERKSAVDKVSLKPLSDWQRQLVEHHKDQFRDYKNKIDLWKALRNKAIKEALEVVGGELKDFEPEPTPPCEGLMLCEEPTLEGLEQLLERGQPSAGIFSDEGGRLVGGHAMNADNALKTACGLSNLWDGKPMTKVRKGEGSKVHYGRRLSLHLMIQPVVLTQLLNNDTLMGQGILSRCLFSAPAPLAGTRKYLEVDLSRDRTILDFYELINRLQDRPYPKNGSGENKIFCPGDALSPKPVGFEEGAKKRWVEFHDETDRKMKEDGEYYPIKPFASKAAEQVSRIAAIFAFSETSFVSDKELRIDLQQLDRAIELVDYYLSEALRILSRSSSDPNTHLATLTLEWIKRSRSDQIFSIADVYQRGPSQIRGAKKAKAIMKILQEHNHVIEVPDAIIDGKKTRSAWRLVSEGR